MKETLKEGRFTCAYNDVVKELTGKYSKREWESMSDDEKYDACIEIALYYVDGDDDFFDEELDELASKAFKVMEKGPFNENKKNAEKRVREAMGTGLGYYVLIAGKGPHGDLDNYSIIGDGDDIDYMISHGCYGYDLLEDEDECVPFTSKDEATEMACSVIRELSTVKNPVMATVIAANDAGNFVSINY